MSSHCILRLVGGTIHSPRLENRWPAISRSPPLLRRAIILPKIREVLTIRLTLVGQVAL